MTIATTAGRLACGSMACTLPLHFRQVPRSCILQWPRAVSNSRRGHRCSLVAFPPLLITWMNDSKEKARSCNAERAFSTNTAKVSLSRYTESNEATLRSFRESSTNSFGRCFRHLSFQANPSACFLEHPPSNSWMAARSSWISWQASQVTRRSSSASPHGLSSGSKERT